MASKILVFALSVSGLISAFQLCPVRDYYLDNEIGPSEPMYAMFSPCPSSCSSSLAELAASSFSYQNKQPVEVTQEPSAVAPLESQNVVTFADNLHCT